MAWKGFASPASLRVLLLSALVALVLYVVSTHRRGPSTAKPRRGAGDRAARQPIKGLAPQKHDVFTCLAHAAYPDLPLEKVRRLFPRKFEVHGHVVVVRLNAGTSADDFRPLARFFAGSFSPVLVDVVLWDVEGIVGELRRPSLEVLYQADTALTESVWLLQRTIQRRWAEARKLHRPSCVSLEELQGISTTWCASPTFTAHVENGVMYAFDVARVMFCSGNTTERMHFATVAAVGEVVVDMFGGIGYFSLPLAMHGTVAVLHALEKNPDSVDFIKMNAVLNKVDHLIRPVCGDNRVVGDELVGTCDRVLMGYIPTCKSFLPRAVSFLKRNEQGRSKGTVHYHFLADKPQAAHEALKDLRDELGAEVADAVHIADLRCVKSYAPKRFHFVADFCFQ